MRKPSAVIFLVAVAVLFLVSNRRALSGYFLPEEIDRLALCATTPARLPVFRVVNPFPLGAEQRAFEDLVLLAWIRLWKLDFRWYAGLLEALHLAGLALLWASARRLGAHFAAAAAGVLSFAILPLVLDAFWRPMWLGQLLCGVLLLASFAAYTRAREGWSLVAFWLAVKCANIALVLPLALAAADLTTGRRDWRRLAPFIAIACGFGIQLLVLNPVEPQSTAVALHGAEFYPLLALAWVFLAASFNRIRWFALAACLILWLPWSYRHLSIYRAATLARTRDARPYFTSLAAQSRLLGSVDFLLLEELPPSVPDWSVARAVHLLTGYREIKTELKTGGRPGPVPPGGAVLRWDGSTGRVAVLPAAPPPVAPPSPPRRRE